MHRPTVISAFVLMAGCASTVSPVWVDASSTDSAIDSTSRDAPPEGGSPRDATPCTWPGPSECLPGLVCLECRAAPAPGRAFCVSACTTDSDCTDPGFPHCVTGGCDGVQYCAETPRGCYCAVCASERTMITTPRGELAIPQVRKGDQVWGVRGAASMQVRVLRVSRTRVWHHTMVKVVLTCGRVLEMSPGHPTMDGRRFGDLTDADEIDGMMIESVERVPYAGEYTYDILTDGDQGAYVAEGVLVGSTLWQRDSERR